MEVAILAVHVLLAISLVALILLQQGKGAEAGASFGGGASQTVFGSSGSGNFMSTLTAWLATGLFLTSFVLAFYAKQQAEAISTSGLSPQVIVEDVANELPALDESLQPLDNDIPTVE